jgi:hypothetical protein
LKPFKSRYSSGVEGERLEFDENIAIKTNTSERKIKKYP